MEHDIAYSKHPKNLVARHRADKKLEEAAWDRVRAQDSSLGEKAVAWAVCNTMKVKRKLGMGLKKSKKKQRKTPLKSIIATVRKSLKKCQGDPVKFALKEARNAIKRAGGRKNITSPRVLPIPSKIGGFLPAIALPIIASISALGSLTGGAASVINAIKNAKAANEKIAEMKRHNETMEAIAMGKGLYLSPYKKGFGLYLAPYSKNK